MHTEWKQYKCVLQEACFSVVQEASVNGQVVPQMHIISGQFKMFHVTLLTSF